MKYSFYNYVFKNGSQSLIYNAATDGTIILQPDLAELIRRHKDEVGKLADVHPELYDAMAERKMIVGDETDECRELISEWEKEDNDPKHYYVTILPTLNCNLRCWYCYEEHNAKAYMNEETMRRVCAFIRSLAEKEELEYLHLSFFGGEPLLPFEKIVWPLLQSVCGICAERNVKVLLHFTTNGVLLTEDVIHRLLTLPLADKPGVQITLDGNRERHDNSRHTATKKGSFDTIVSNIHSALREGLFVNVRFNYTAESVDSFVDVLDDFEKLDAPLRERLHFDFQQVWQESHREDIRERAIHIARKFAGQSFNTRIEKRYNRDRCKSDADNQVEINYDGRLFSCTARDTMKEECEGFLSENGELVRNERHRKRMEVKYGNATCQACKIYPICHGGCSQMKLESDMDKGCLRGLSEEQKLEIIQGRLEFVLKNKRTRY